MARTQRQDSTNRIEDKLTSTQTDQEVHKLSKRGHS